jgi:hypothetical protein
MIDIQALIASLGQDAKPVRPLWPPALRATLWLVCAISLIVIFACERGLHNDLAFRFSRREFVVEWFGLLSIGMGSAFAAFYLSVPGRSSRWSLLPLPGLMLWLFSMSYGCYADWNRLGLQGFIPGASFECLEFIVQTTVPLSIALLFLLRHAALIRPASTTVLATLSIATLAAAGQSLTHHFDTTIMVLVWHAGTTAVLLAAARLVGPRLMARLLAIPCSSR